MDNTRLYVGNIDYRMPIQELEVLFAQFGSVDDVFLPAPQERGDASVVNRGFAFVRFTSPEAAEAALALHKTNDPLFKRRLIVQFAKPRPEKT